MISHHVDIGSIRPYLEAACKWYSEADAGPGAEAGSGAVMRSMECPLGIDDQRES